MVEDKELPQLSITSEPPNSRDVVTGGNTTLTCLAESKKTENIGYSWDFANSNSVIVVSLVCNTLCLQIFYHIPQMAAFSIPS